MGPRAERGQRLSSHCTRPNGEREPLSTPREKPQRAAEQMGTGTGPQPEASHQSSAAPSRAVIADRDRLTLGREWLIRPRSSRRLRDGCKYSVYLLVEALVRSGSGRLLPNPLSTPPSPPPPPRRPRKRPAWPVVILWTAATGLAGRFRRGREGQVCPPMLHRSGARALG